MAEAMESGEATRVTITLGMIETAVAHVQSQKRATNAFSGQESKATDANDLAFYKLQVGGNMTTHSYSCLMTNIVYSFLLF